MLSETVSIPHVGRNVMYAYFALGEVPYLCVSRQNGGYAISPVADENGSLAPCGNWGQSPSETVEFSEIDADSGKMASFLAGVVKESGTYVILSPAVPKHVLKTFTRPFADIAGLDSPPLWDHVLTGNIEEPRSLMRNFIAVNGLPHWWKEGGKYPISNIQYPVSSVQYSVASGGGGSDHKASLRLCGSAREKGKEGEVGQSAVLRPLTKKIGTGRMAVAVFGDDESGYSLDLGLWSPAQGRVLNSSEEASSQKCRFTTSNPTATHFQKRIFAEIAAETAIFKHYDFKTWGLSPIDEVVQFVERYDAVVVVAETIPRYVVERILSAFGPQRVFSPPYIGLSRSASGGGSLRNGR